MKVRRTFTRVLFMILALASVAASALGQDILLGVLEDVPGVYAGEPNSSRVRVAFRKTGKEWKAFPSEYSDQACLKTLSSQYPREVDWTVGFDGRSLGRVKAQTPRSFDFYSHVGLQEVTAGPVPTIGKRSPEYGDFTSAPVTGHW
jgi:hypothetical protein